MHQVEAINRWNPFRVWRALKTSDAFVSGGGGLLQDRTSRRSLIYYLALSHLAHFFKKPVFLVGQGIGPLSHRLSRILVTRCLNAEYIMVRDEASLELLRELKVKAPVALGEDLALAYPLETCKRQHGTCARFLGVSLRGDFPAQLVKALASCLDEICRRLKLKALFIPAFPQQDLSLAEALAEAMRGDAIVIDTKKCSIAEMIDCIASCTLLIGSRLHALEFALMNGVPLVAINTDPKIEAFVRRLEFCSGLRVPLVQFTSLQVHKLTGLMEDVEELWAKRGQYQQAFQRCAHILRASAERGLRELCQKMAPFLNYSQRGDL